MPQAITYKAALQHQIKTLFYNWRFLLHIIFWTLIIWGTSAIATPEEAKVLATDAALKPYLIAKYCTYIFVLLGSVYTFLLVLVPFANVKNAKWILIIGIFIIILVYTIIGQNINESFYIPSALRAGKHNWFYTLGATYERRLRSIWFFFSLYYFFDLYQQQKQLNIYSKILVEKTEVEKAFLQNQINPHFLFNTLNNLYSLALSKNEDGVLIAKQLKALYAYMLYDCTQDKVSLQGEIDFLKNYIGLEKIRNKKENLTITINSNQDLTNYTIAPLLLINFLENAFKHGVKSNVDESFVKVNVSVINNQLLFDMSNSVPPNTDKSQAIQGRGGIGLTNVKRRLEILYPNKFTLKIAQSETVYNTYLEIKL